MFNLRVNGEKELALVCAHPGVHHSLGQFCMFVYEPSLSQNIGSSVFQLKQSNIRGWNDAGRLTRLVSWVSIMKLCTCFSALVSSSFLLTTATSSAVQPAPWTPPSGYYSTYYKCSFGYGISTMVINVQCSQGQRKHCFPLFSISIFCAHEVVGPTIMPVVTAMPRPQ